MSRESYNVDNREQKSLLEGVRVSALCKVTKFDASTMTVDVQPLSKALDGGVYRTPPPVLGVPVAMIRGGGFFLRPWYKSGDVGVIVYADHDIDRIAEAGQECQPNTERNHGDEDGIFVGAFTPKSNPISGVPDDTLVMSTEGGSVYIALHHDHIEIKGDIKHTGDIEQTGNKKQTGRTDVTEDVTAAGISLVHHTHTGDSGGSTSQPH